MDVVDEPLDAVHLDHGDPLAVARLELVDARDVHDLELERRLLAHAVHHAARGVAEVAALRPVEDDLRRYG
jgi:hypothetical protein